MKPIFFHFNNLSINSIESQKLDKILFSPNNAFDLDEQIHNFLIKNLLGKETTAFFIKASLSINYLDFVGIRLALHIRFTKELNDLKNLPIFIISELSEQALLRLYDYPGFLLSKGTYIISESEVENFIDEENKVTQHGCSDISYLRNKFTINIPDEFDSHHSVANEWSILRWSKLLNIKNEFTEINHLRSKFEYLLYYKFLTSAFGENNESLFNINNIRLKDCKIKYIDDDATNGWNSIFSKLFKELDAKFTPCEYKFKDKSYDELESDILSQIQDEDPDIIILDLRLLKLDFEISTHISNISGYKLLQAIKKFNEGIQVIIFTASNKSWNLQSLLKEGADGFCIKESPIYVLPNQNSNNTLLNFIILMQELSTIVFLKKVCILFRSIKNNFDLLFEDNHNLKQEISLFIDLSFRLLRETRFHNKYFNYAFIQAFHLIELFVSQESIFKDGSSAFVIVDNNEILVQDYSSNIIRQAITFTDNYKYELKQNKFKNNVKHLKRLDTNFKISAIIIFRFGYTNSSVHKWTKIYTIRNTKAAHYNNNNIISKDELILLLHFIEFITNIKNINLKNSSKGLKQRSIEEVRNEALSSGDPRFKPLKTDKRR